MARPLSDDGPATRVMRRRRRRALGYGDLPPEMKDAIQDYLRHTNESLRSAVAEYFEDKAACERRHGKMNTWDVGRVTDMSHLFSVYGPDGNPTNQRQRRTQFNEDISVWDTLV